MQNNKGLNGPVHQPSHADAGQPNAGGSGALGSGLS